MTFQGTLQLVLRWIMALFRYPSSKEKLEATEKEILSYLKTPYEGRFVNIGAVVGTEDCEIWTVTVNEGGEKTPIVLFHGFAQGLGFWALNLDSLAKERPVYAIDMPGFGRSSRTKFSRNALEVETQMIDIIESWRKEMKLEKFILLGHSLGGYFATCYAFKYPERLPHLILIEPWGFPKKPRGITCFIPKTPLNLPSFAHPVIYFATRLTNPLLGFRLIGWFGLGPFALRLVLPELSSFNIIGEKGNEKIVDYLFHCNSRKPSGEGVLRALSSSGGYCWAKFPFCDRVVKSLHKDVPITWIHGSKSWVYKTTCAEIQELRPSSYFDEQLMEGIGHDCYFEDHVAFNKIVHKVYDLCEQNEEKIVMPHQKDVILPNDKEHLNYENEVITNK